MSVSYITGAIAPAMPTSRRNSRNLIVAMQSRFANSAFVIIATPLENLVQEHYAKCEHYCAEQRYNHFSHCHTYSL